VLQWAAVAAYGKGKAEIKPKPVDHVPKAMNGSDILESSKNAAWKESNGKVPYCFRCKTKGHVIAECHTAMYCDICESQDHIRQRHPKFRAVKGSAVPCGYAVEGLGCFHITHEASQKQRNDIRIALIKVTDGDFSIPNVITELERLIPGSWNWNVEAWETLLSRLFFPSKAEMQCMVEWRIVHTKIQNAKLQIEEVKFVLRKVWV
jgi:hypothetical protein